MKIANDKPIACDMCGEAMKQSQDGNWTCSECPNCISAEDAWQYAS